MSTESLLRVQMGKQTVFGTGVAATSKLMGLLKATELAPIADAEVLETEIGSMGPGPLAVLNATAGGGSLQGYVLYEDIPYMLDSLASEATPSGAGPYTRDWSGPLGTAPTPRINTIERGDGVLPAYRLVGGVVSKLTIKGEMKKTWTYQGDLVGKSVEPNALTGSLNDRTVLPVHGSQTQIYVDAWAGTIGTTEWAAMNYAFELTLDATRAIEHFMGNLAPQDWNGDLWDVMLKLSVKLNATTKAVYDAQLGSALAQRQVRIKATSGTNVCQLDVAGTLVEPPKQWEVRDHVLALTFTIKGTYNSALANYFKAQVVNGVAVMP